MHSLRSNRRSVRALPLATLVLAASLSPALAAQTLSRIQGAGRINIGFIADQAPFSSVSPAGRPDGYAVELCQQVVDTLKAERNLVDLAVSFVPASVSSGLTMVEEGKADLLCGAIVQTAQARERVSFSIPIYYAGIGALVREDAPPALVRVLSGQVAHTGPTWRATVNAGLANHTYAFHAGAATEAWIRERIAMLGVIAKVLAVPAYKTGVDMVAAGKVHAFFADRAVLATAVAGHAAGRELVVLERRFTVNPVALAMQRGDEDFRLAVDKALSKLYRSGDYANAYAPRFGAPSETARILFQAHALP